MTGTEVRQIELPSDARALSRLSDIGYEDAFLVDAGPGRERTAEHWARTMLEGAPSTYRHALPRGWAALGLRLNTASPARSVLGWEMVHNTPDVVLLAAQSRLGLSGELLFQRQPHALLFATLLRLDNLAARALWTGISHHHRTIVQQLLEHASRPEGAVGP